MLACYNWNNYFKILTELSPPSLFKFIFTWTMMKLFFDNWKGRHPMQLQIHDEYFDLDSINLIEKYKAEGIVKHYEIICDECDDEY